MIRVCFTNAWHKTCTIYLSMYMLSCDSLFILSHRFQFVKTFLKFFKKVFNFFSTRTLLFPVFFSPLNWRLDYYTLYYPFCQHFFSTFFIFFYFSFCYTIYCGLLSIIYTISAAKAKKYADFRRHIQSKIYNTRKNTPYYNHNFNRVAYIFMSIAHIRKRIRNKHSTHNSG